MRRLLSAPVVGATALAALTFSPAALADYGSAGCGLGSMIITQDNILQIFAATTNGTFANQTFGITFGTSNCTSTGVVRADKEQEAFAEANLDALRRDMARGQGEYLDAFATLLACEADVQPAIGGFAQDHYEAVFPTETTTPMQALYGFKLQLSMDPVFADGCKRI